MTGAEITKYRELKKENDFVLFTGYSKKDFSNLSEEKKTKKIRSFINTYSKKNNFSSDESSDDEFIPPKSKKMKKSSPKKEVIKKDANDNEFKFENGTCYFTNKQSNIASSNLLNLHDIPENTIFKLKQAKYYHCQNKFGSGNGGKIGKYSVDLELIGQVIPGKKGEDGILLYDEEIYTESCDSNHVGVPCSNPSYQASGKGGKPSFKYNHNTSHAIFQTVLDKQNRTFLDFGAEKNPPKTGRTLPGRRQRMEISKDISVFATSSSEKLIENFMRNETEPIYIYRVFQTDPLHLHNLSSKNGKPIIYFNYIPSQKLMDCDVIKVDDEGKVEENLDVDVSGQGNVTEIKKICDMLYWVLSVSEKDLENNKIKGSSSGNQKLSTALPSYMDLGQCGSKRAMKTSESDIQKNLIIEEDEDEEEVVWIPYYLLKTFLPFSERKR